MRWDPHVIAQEAKRRIKPPLSRGDVVVWSTRHHGATSGISAAHRYLEIGRTYCLLHLPKDPTRLLDLALVQPPTCEVCDRLFAAGATVAEAEQDNINRANQAQDVA